MIIEYIATGIAGVFVGFLLACHGINNVINEQKKRLQEFRKELNTYKKIRNLHIGQVVYACKYNSFYMGEITKITHSESDTTIELNNNEVFRICDTYTDQNEALQQIKI